MENRRQKASLGLNQWIDLTGIDSHEFIILWLLFSDKALTRGYTKGRIASQLNVWNHIIEVKLKHLRQLGFIHTKHISFGGRDIQVYHLSELGLFLFHYLETQFHEHWINPSYGQPSPNSNHYSIPNVM